uniref:Uncharacterized protein n=1 Tax=Parascaris univalens TaxID=6257 RepID=A0A915CJE9_PARUN
MGNIPLTLHFSTIKSNKIQTHPQIYSQQEEKQRGNF